MVREERQREVAGRRDVPKGTVEEKGDRSAFGKEQGAQENRAGTGSATGHGDAGTQACNLVETGRSV